MTGLTPRDSRSWFLTRALAHTIHILEWNTKYKIPKHHKGMYFLSRSRDSPGLCKRHVSATSISVTLRHDLHDHTFCVQNIYFQIFMALRCSMSGARILLLLSFLLGNQRAALVGHHLMFLESTINHNSSIGSTVIGLRRVDFSTSIAAIAIAPVKSMVMALMTHPWHFFIWNISRLICDINVVDYNTTSEVFAAFFNVADHSGLIN